jgi:hypothetical protein
MRHCCDEMAFHVAQEDRVVRFSARFMEYSIPVHDGGTSGIIMRFCPWCGSRLPDSRRDEVLDSEEGSQREPSSR